MATPNWINDEEVIKRLSRRYNISKTPTRQESLLLPSSLQMVADINEMMSDFKVEDLGQFSRLAASGAGVVDIWTNNTDYRYRLYVVELLTAAGDGTIQHLYVDDGNSVLPTIYSQTAAVSMKTGLLTQIISLDRDHKLACYVAAISTDSTWNIHVLYQRLLSFSN